MRGPFPTIVALLGILTAVRPARGQVIPKHIQSVAHGLAIRAIADTTPATAAAEPRLAVPSAPPVEQVVGSTVGAFVGGFVGFYGLGHVAFVVAGGGTCGDDACGFIGGLLGAVLGEAVGIGLGAHLGNGRRGDPLSPVAASLGVLVLAGMVGQYVDLGGDAIYAIPIAQVAAAVWAELASARGKAGRENRRA